MHDSFHGALVRDGGVLFRVWAPKARRVGLVLYGDLADRELEPQGGGLFETFVEGLGPGTPYRYRLDGGEPFPDPASRFQPNGVHGPSEVVDPAASAWRDEAWKGRSMWDLVFYELHVGAFTPEGTFDAARERLGYLRDLGVTAVELMPVADFPGRWNWGYDHAALFAPSRAYGRPDDLRRLVDAAHELGLAVFLDVIYNHLGPDGAYLAAYAPMFTDRHHTPWGSAINLDDQGSEGVRRFFIDNACHWLREYHLDGLRLDATDALKDDSRVHFLTELTAAVDALPGPTRLLVAEDHRNLNTLLLPRDEGGHGLDGVWADNFHHQIRNLTAGDRDSYYANFEGTTAADLAVTVRQGWYYDGRPSIVTGKPLGTPTDDIEPEQCVVCIQNHDQIGNRATGNRLTDDVSLPVYRAASALLLFAPTTPLLFMGQEWAAGTSFQFFTDHEPELGELVTEGRLKEFSAFTSFGGHVPDPQDASTFERSRLDWSEPERPPHAGTLALYRALLRLRPALDGPAEAEAVSDTALTVHRGPYHLLVNLTDAPATFSRPEGAEVLLHTEDGAFTEDPRPPAIEDETIRFERAGAVILHD